MKTTDKVDWKALEAAAVAHLAATVRQVRDKRPQERIYGAMFNGFYGDGEVIYWPCVTVGTEESLAEVIAQYRNNGYAEPGLGETLRWSGADLPYTEEPGEAENAWAQQVQAAAAQTGKFSNWERVYDRFLRCFARAAKQARAELVAQGWVDKAFIAIAEDEAGELIPLSLSKAQLRKHFPQFDQAEVERRRIAALPLAEQVAEVIPHAVSMDYTGALGSDEYAKLARALGASAVPALVDVVAGKTPGQVWKACMLLAEIGHDDPVALAALEHAMCDGALDGSTRAWAASALARLGHTERITSHLTELPVDVVASGVAAPYGSFRDYGKHGILDYRPLEALLAVHPHLEAAVAEATSGYCAITAEEIPIAQVALASVWEVVRTHARIVLEDRHDRYGDAPPGT